MIYRNDEIDSDYDHIAEISDNYIVWVRENKLNSGTSYNAYIQYLNPSFSYFFTEDYKITKGDDYTYNANYVNNGMYSYIDNYSLDYSLDTYSIDSDFISTNDTTRSDFIFIGLGIFLTCFFMLWIFKQLSRLFFKGGLN